MRCVIRCGYDVGDANMLPWGKKVFDKVFDKLALRATAAEMFCNARV